MSTAMRLLTLTVMLALCAGVVVAGCGHKDTHKGTLTSVDADNNQVVVADEDGKEVKLTLTSNTQVMDAEGNETKVSELVGQKVEVVSEHAKVDSIKQMA